MPRSDSTQPRSPRNGTLCTGTRTTPLVARHGPAPTEFVYCDLRRLHRMGLIACHYRAAEWRHMEIELAAHELLQYLDRKTAQ